MDEHAGRIAVGGMDAGIEDLLLDAGGEWLRGAASPRAAEVPPGPWVVLMFGDGRATAGAVALRVCLDYGWPAEWSPLGTGGGLRVQELVATRLLALLSRKLVSPDAVAFRTSDLTPAQIRGIREALPADASLVVDPPHERPDLPTVLDAQAKSGRRWPMPTWRVADILSVRFRQPGDRVRDRYTLAEERPAEWTFGPCDWEINAGGDRCPPCRAGVKAAAKGVGGEEMR